MGSPVTICDSRTVLMHGTHPWVKSLLGWMMGKGSSLPSPRTPVSPRAPRWSRVTAEGSVHRARRDSALPRRAAESGR